MQSLSFVNVLQKNNTVHYCYALSRCLSKRLAANGTGIARHAALTVRAS
jgi:hypothetical protein